jgi:ribonucleoside-diphosphate reductase alpha chain
MNRPKWMTDEAYKTLKSGYLQEGETPNEMYSRVAASAAENYKGTLYSKEFLENRFLYHMMENNLCPASPVLSNMGTARGLPISCFGVSVKDSIDSIFNKSHELAILSKSGGGVSLDLTDIRHRGSPVRGNGKSEGVVPWCKLYDTTTQVVSQGSTRRGASAVYLPIEHPDIMEFLRIRRPAQEENLRCMNLNHAVSIPDAWMKDMIAGDSAKREVWVEILRTREETGQPYLFFRDTVNNNNPPAYKNNNLEVNSSNLCSEIFLHSSEDNSFICCLSSLNLYRWEEWEKTDLVEMATIFLDCVLQEFIEKAPKINGLQSALNSAIKGRALGLGVLGWHSLLQRKMLPWDSFKSMALNALIFKTIRDRSFSQSQILAKDLGEPEWCVGTGMRNTHLMALAPTVSNSLIAGGHSPGIEPWAANFFILKSAKGTFFKKNSQLEKVLEELGQNKEEIWKKISLDGGSVQELSFLDEKTKKVFLTAREINQSAIVRQASQRQKFIDQGQSVNLFFTENANPKEINKVHIEAWEQGLKSLYYFRSEGVLKNAPEEKECAACEG